jgi:hypothetical protein
MRILILMLVVFAGAVARADGLKPFNPADYPSDVQKALRYANEAAYCGTGGCIIDLLVTLPNGSVRRVFDGHVRNYEIMPTPMKRGAGRHPLRVAWRLLQRSRLAILLQGEGDRHNAVRVQDAAIVPLLPMKTRCRMWRLAWLRTRAPLCDLSGDRRDLS